MAAETDALTPSYLRCEYRVDPLGIDVRDPRLSWIVESSQRGQKQTAYRVLVAGSEEDLAADKGTLWDSGKVASDQTAHVVYAGRPLRTRTRCWWKVRVWDRHRRRSAWSKPAVWTMGLLRPSDWAAQWIGFDEPGPAPGAKARHSVPAPDKAKQKPKLVLPPPRYLRREVALARPIGRATVYAAALGIYELRINGRKVGGDYFTPGWTDYGKRITYQTYDVTDLLKQGANAIGAVLADGWYAGYIGGTYERHHYGSKLRLRAQVHVEYEDGTEQVVATDGRWRASTGPLREADFLMGETCDARREMPGWDAAGFDASGWKRVNVTRSVNASVQSYAGAPVRQFAELKPAKVTEPKAGRFVFDLGRNFAGVVRLRVAGARRGRKITLRFAERLNPDGTVYTANLRTARSIDTYTCRGGGEEIWQPRFTYHGFQYVELTGYPGRPGRDAVTGIALSAATPTVGSFECSDETANKLYGNICWTQRANFIEVPTDCPQRDERLGWSGDAQAYIRTATCNTDVAAFFTKWLADLVDAQTSGGRFPDVAPHRVATGSGVAAWADAGIICPWTIWQVYGDRRVLERTYAAMARYVAFCKKDSKGLLRPDYGFGDWLSINAETPKDVLATAYFAYSTKLMSQIAAALGKAADAKKYDALFGRIAKAFTAAYVDDDGRIKGDTQTVYVLALAFDLLPEAKRQAALARLVADIESRGGRLSTGFVGTKDLMDVLTRFGRLDVAYRLLHNETFPSWGFAIKHGATSIWERWDGWTPEKGFQNPAMNSFSHYAFGSVGQWIFRTIGGIDAAEPGFRRITIAPRPGGRLTWARTSYRSIRGRIATDWKLTTRGLTLNVTVPANTTARVHVPAKAASAVTESGRPAARADGVKFLRLASGAAVYEVGSGSYRFISKGWRLRLATGRR